MKFSWGTGIALFYATFAIGMVTMVITSRKHDPGLMQTDYYELDLHYQQRLDKKQNASQLKSLPQVVFNLEKNSVEVAMPPNMSVHSGTAKCYRSATTGEDFSIPIEQQNTFNIPAATLTPGRWHIELDWEADGKAYFYQTTFTVTHA